MAKKHTQEEEELAATLGAAFAADILEGLPEIGKGLANGEGEGSYSATVQFSPEYNKPKRGETKEVVGYRAMFKPRVRVPRPTQEFKLGLSQSGQLSLFEGEEA